MITIYYSPFTRSHLVRFLVEELEIPHRLEVLDLAKGEHKSPDYRRVQPLGLLPAVVDEAGLATYECGAIALALTDGVPDRRMAPPLGSPDRATYYQWVLFAFATELIALSKIAMHTRFLPPEARVPAIAEDGRQAWPAIARVIEDRVRDRTWLLGETFSTADVVVGGSLWLAHTVGVLGDFPDLVKYYRRIEARPAFKKGFAEVL